VIESLPSDRRGPQLNAVRVLVVDHERPITELVSAALRFQRWEAVTATDGAAAIRVARDYPPDVAVLSMTLPDMSGIELLGRLREYRPNLPVVVLTDSVEDRIAGLAAGGDDCVARPFSVEELTLRVRAVLRRAGILTGHDSPRIVVGNLVLDEESWEVTRDGTPIVVTAKEFELLRFLMRNQRRVLSKREILQQVWHDDTRGRANIVELYVSYLRKKIDSGHYPMIHTLRGVGYVLKPAA
jgi:two-component system, OmpR family, response regulator